MKLIMRFVANVLPMSWYC